MVDENPRFHLEVLRWYAALIQIAGVTPSDLVVHVVGSTGTEALDFLRSEGVTVRSVDRFDPRSPHCNKISGALQLSEEEVDGLAVLCDTDVVVLEDPRRIEFPSGSVAGKVVDAPVPPLKVLLGIFAAAGLSPPPTVPLPWGPGQATVSGNNNGGLCLVPGRLLRRVTTGWARWATWLLDRAELLESWSVHVDQVALALALTAEDIPSFALDVRWNTPIHDPTRIPTDPAVPAIIHYHQEVDRRGLLRPTGKASIDGRIGTVNEAVRQVWARAKPRATFRAWLTESEPGDAVARELRRVLAAVVEAAEPATVLDVGGDSGIGRLTTASCTSIDRSTDARQVLAEGAVRADLVLCLRQLAQAADVEACRELVGLLWASTTGTLILRGFEDLEAIPAASASDEPLSTILRDVAPDAELYPVAAHGPITTFAVVRPAEDKHPRDFVPATLTPLLDRHPDPLSLLVLRLHALRTTHFYPDHSPRLWEYPVVARLLSEQLAPGSRLIDVGAGVTPLAPFLTSRGYVVDTVDPSTAVRTWPPQPDWNEWDFLDYGAAGLAHRSWNSTLHRVPSWPPFDGVYSISVIEHLPATVRRDLLADMSVRTRLGGLVVLTIDLVRGTEDLWNLNLGVVVEDLARHGTLGDVVRECRELGLELFEQDVVRDWGDSRVDIALLALRQTKDPSKGAWRSARRRLASLVRGSTA